MGRNNKSYHKDLKQQIYEKLTTMLKNGEGRSKTADKDNNIEITEKKDLQR